MGTILDPTRHWLGGMRALAMFCGAQLALTVVSQPPDDVAAFVFAGSGLTDTMAGLMLSASAIDDAMWLGVLVDALL